MPNDLQEFSGGLTLQVTIPARQSELAEENDDGEWTRLAEVRVYAFDNLLIVVDLEKMSDEEIAELVNSATRDTKSIHQAIDSKIRVSGNGCKLQLSNATDAGFRVKQSIAWHPAPNMMILTPYVPEQEKTPTLAADLVGLRRMQLDNTTQSTLAKNE